jgi:hypothetical protein
MPVSLYVLMVWCLIKHRNNCIFSFIFISWHHHSQSYWQANIKWRKGYFEGSKFLFGWWVYWQQWSLLTYGQHLIHRLRHIHETYIFSMELPVVGTSCYWWMSSLMIRFVIRRMIGRHSLQEKRDRFRSESAGTESGNKIWRHGRQVFGVFKKCLD